MKAIEELLRTVLATGGCKLLAIREEGGAAAAKPLQDLGPTHCRHDVAPTAQAGVKSRGRRYEATHKIAEGISFSKTQRTSRGPQKGQIPDQSDWDVALLAAAKVATCP